MANRLPFFSFLRANNNFRPLLFTSRAGRRWYCQPLGKGSTAFHPRYVWYSLSLNFEKFIIDLALKYQRFFSSQQQQLILQQQRSRLLQQQTKQRLLHLQQHQQLLIPSNATANSGDPSGIHNIDSLMNSTVAPNVSLQVNVCFVLSHFFSHSELQNN